MSKIEYFPNLLEIWLDWSVPGDYAENDSNNDDDEQTSILAAFIAEYMPKRRIYEAENGEVCGARMCQ